MKKIILLQYLLSILVFLSITTKLDAQLIEKQGYDHYTYNSTTYNYDKLNTILASNPEALAKYQKAMRAKKTSKILAYISLGIAAGTVLTPVVDEIINPDRWCDFICGPEAIAIIGVVFVAPLVMSSALVVRLSYLTRRKKSIQLFNEGRADLGLLEKYELGSELQLTAGQTAHGLGVVIGF